ncbi:MAG: fibronectin type III domain-containing protein [Candidatus Doudnabacteria bacterium]|nr:fibronectin type III domain-containing protein [Candidatus Doudnabacteria bacterium]
MWGKRIKTILIALLEALIKIIALLTILLVLTALRLTVIAIGSMVKFINAAIPRLRLGLVKAVRGIRGVRWIVGRGVKGAIRFIGFIKNNKNNKILLSLINSAKRVFALARPYFRQAISTVIIISLVVTSLVFYKPQTVQGANYTFFQTDWAGLEDGGTRPVHPTNQTGWNKYDAKDSAVTTPSGSISLSATSSSTTQTSDTDFNAGTLSSTAVSGSGSGASVILASNGSTWGSESNIDTTGDVGSYPSIAAVNSNTLYISYIDVTNAGLKFAKSTDGGSNWTLSTVGTASTQYTSIVAPDANTIFISYYTGDLKFAKSTDGGSNWTLSTVDSAADEGLYSSIDSVGTSTIFISYHDLTNGDLKFAKSTDGGSNWTASIVDSTGTVTGVDTSIDAVDENTIYISYRNDTASDLKFAKSTDGGSNWTLATLNSGNISEQSTSIVAIDANTIYVSYYEATGDDVEVAKSTDGGSNWTIQLADSEAGTGAYSSITAVDANNLFISYYREGGTNDDYLAAIQTTNGGSNWSTTLLSDGTNFAGLYNSIQAVDVNNVFIASYSNGSVDNLRFVKRIPTYPSSGTYTSASIDTGQNSDYTTIAWTETLPANTDITFKLAHSTDGSSFSSFLGPDGTTGTSFTTSGGENIPSDFDGKRYIKIQATLTTSDATAYPTLSDVTINFQYYAASSTLTFSGYNASDATNAVSKLQWSETLASGTDIKFQVRTAATSGSNPGTWSNFCGPDNAAAGCSTTTYFTDPAGGETVDADFRDGSNDQWVQVKVFMTSDGLNAPTLSDFTLTYVVNAPPAFDTTDVATASQNTDTTVTVSYTIKDTDTASGATTPNFVTPSFEYSTDGGSNYSSIPAARITYGSAPVGGQVTDTNSDGNTDNKVLAGSFLTYTAIWDAKTHLGATIYETDARVRVTINDNEGTNNTAQQATANFTLDTKNPVPGTPTGGGTGANINQNAATSLSNQKTSTTAVTLTISSADDSSQQMIISESSSFTGASYEAYAASKSFTLSSGDGTKTVYIKFKDAVGNVSDSNSDTVTLDTTAPAAPGNTLIQEISNSATSEYRMFFTWGVSSESDWVKYEVYRSTNGTDYSLLSTITNINTNYVVDTGLTSGTIYYYKVRAVDDISNNSSYSSVKSLTAGGNPADAVAPTITSVASGTETTSSATITWTTNEVADSTVQYSIDGSYGSSQGLTGYRTSHSVRLVGLSAGTTYNYRVRSCDASSNCTTSSSSTFSTSSADATGPTISAISAGTPSTKSATITWTTNEASSSFVEYSTTNGFSSGTLYGVYDSVTSHSVVLPAVLSAGTTYYYKVRSKDASGNETTSAQNSFATAADPSDSTAPTISSISTSGVAYNTATVTWTTNETATSFVEFGQTSSYGRVAGNYTLATSHSVSLPLDLAAATAYNFRVRSADASGNEAVSSNSTFTTSASPNDSTAPTISSVSSATPTATSVIITWTTNEVADSFVEYSEGNATYTLSQGNGSMVTSHSVTLVGLTPSKQYYYRVKSADPSGNIRRDDNSGSGYTFSTAGSSSSPPVISNIQISGVTSNTAAITWTTDKASDSFVEFGFDTTYGRVAGAFNSVTSHSVNLPQDLLGDVTYHFRVRSKDSDNNLAVSEDQTFTTNPSSAVTTAEDSTAPTVSSVTASLTAYDQVMITWTTNEAATSQVDYGLTNSYGSTTTLDSTLTVQHAVKISSLSASTAYYFRVKSKDGNNNETTDDNSGAGYTFTTPANKADTTGPIVSLVTAGTLSQSGAVISWTTNESASSTVEYGTTTSLGSVAGSASESVTSHSVTLSGLSQNTLYYYRVITTDSSGNTTTDNNSGNYYTFTTSADTTAPIITSVSASVIGETSVAIFWTTNEAATSQVDYGSTNSYGSSTTLDSTLVTSHAVTFSGLNAGATYYYRVKSKDAADNLTTDDNSGAGYSFRTITLTSGGGGGGTADTTAPVISKVIVTDITENSAVIKWEVSEVSNNKLKYGKLSNYNKEYSPSGTDNFSVALTGLDPATIYHFQIVATDVIGNIGRTEDKTFGTLGAGEIPKPTEKQKEAPEVSKEEEVKIQSIIAQTEEVGVSKLVYKASAAFLSQILGALASNPAIEEVEESKFIESIQEIAPKIVAAPVISGSDLSVEVGPTWAKVSWTTDKKAGSLVAFAPATDYDSSKETPYLYKLGDPEENTTRHQVYLPNLTPQTIYHYQVMSKSSLGEWAKSADRTFQTLALTSEVEGFKFTGIRETEAAIEWETQLPTKTIIDVVDSKTGATKTYEEPSYLLDHQFTISGLVPATSYSARIVAIDESGNRSAANVFPFSTFISLNPPEITRVRANTSLIPGKIEKIQTIITWATNKPASSRVLYDETLSGELKLSTPLDANLVMDHAVITTAFKPGRVYRFRAESTDAAGNASFSQDFTLLTPRPKETVIDLIFKNFEQTFGFLKKVGF